MKILKTMLLNAASLLGVYMLGLFILYLALDGQLDRVPDWSATVMLIPAVVLWALLSPWKLIGLERRSEDAETNARKWRGEAMNLDSELRLVLQRCRPCRRRTPTHLSWPSTTPIPVTTPTPGCFG